MFAGNDLYFSDVCQKKIAINVYYDSLVITMLRNR